MPFIPPMLATRLEDPRRLADPCYVAEPKLDGGFRSMSEPTGTVILLEGISEA
jgi:hypothetical protein